MVGRTLRHWGWACVLAAVPVVAAAADDLVARARQLYNARQYDAAIAVARDALRKPGAQPAAAVVLARAHLERFRKAGAAPDVAAAREALTSIDAARLQPAERAELLVGWAELHYLEGKTDVAAELFDAALAGHNAGHAVTKDRLLDWWAHCVERTSQDEPAAARERSYARILGRMEREMERGPDSPAIIYWLAAAARGTGDLDRAWHAARAGWIRARIAPGGEAPRTDLDRLVVDAIIPERARRAGGSDTVRTRIAADMHNEWDQLKRAW